MLCRQLVVPAARLTLYQSLVEQWTIDNQPPSYLYKCGIGKVEWFSDININFMLLYTFYSLENFNCENLKNHIKIIYNFHHGEGAIVGTVTGVIDGPFERTMRHRFLHQDDCRSVAKIWSRLVRDEGLHALVKGDTSVIGRNVAWNVASLSTFLQTKELVQSHFGGEKIATRFAPLLNRALCIFK